ncbi:MAG: ATP-binding cassette domain-containing protein [Geminicoccaceae bacterium]
MSAALRVIEPLVDLPAMATPATEPGLAVQLDRVVKRFGEREVLEGVGLDIPAGRFVAVVGRSGGGKSTLLRLLAGLETQTSGRILLDRQPFAGLPLGVRMLFQDARLLPWQRVLDNVGIARGPSWRERAQAVLADVGLGDRGHDWPAVLSGGQRQRVALARALVSRPRLLLLDEPFGALDALTRMEMHDLLGRIWVRERFTTVLITHDVVEAVTLADRVLVLKEGRVALDLPVEVRRPRRSDDPRLLALERRVLDAV